MSKPRLTYFNGRGLAEVARLIFVDSGVEYEDRRLEDIKDLKESGALVYGQVPLLETAEVKLVQSNTINRYLARVHGLNGDTAVDAAKIDQLVDGVGDLRSGWYRQKTEEEKETYKKDRVPFFLKSFEKQLGSGPFLLGQKLSWGDLVLFVTTENISTLFGAKLEDYPVLKAHFERVAARPNIAAWLKKRPVTSF
jgi:glutathione S-transferase